MKKRPRRPILLVCAAIGVACGSERAFEPERPIQPERPPVLTTFEVGPTLAELFTDAPGNTVQLSIEARDQTGERMPGEGAATYFSTAPWIAAVSSRGVVTADAPGTAVITAMLTLGGVTRTDAMIATVRFHDEAPREYPGIAGVYDLTALITNSDPAWGIPDGTRQTAVITIQDSRDTPQLGGTFAHFCAIGPDGEACNENPGLVSGFLHLDGRVVIELTFKEGKSSYWYGAGTLASGQIVGKFGAGGHISGTFVAKRR